MAVNTGTRSGMMAGRSRTKAALLGLLGLVLVPTALLEAASQLKGGVASPVGLPLLTTPAVLDIKPETTEEVLRGTAKPDERHRLAALGARRLEAEPLDPAGLWLWSLDKKAAKARQALELADKVSRRDRIVQLDLMRTKALAGDLRGGLNHLDIALTVSPKAAPQILQLIAAGLSEPQLIRLLQPYERRPWFVELVTQAVAAGPQPENAAQLLWQSRLTGAELPPTLLPSVMSRLVQAGNVEMAERLATRFAGMTGPAIDQFGPTRASSIQAALPLSWQLVQDSSVYVELIDNGVSVEIEPGLGGVMLSRVTGYKPGVYTLQQDVRASTEELRLTWRLSCLVKSGERQVASQRLPTSVTKQTVRVPIIIPSGCPAQKWVLVGSNQSGVDRALSEISAISLIDGGKPVLSTDGVSR